VTFAEDYRVRESRASSVGMSGIACGGGLIHGLRPFCHE
jgi:hypothetical protein